MKPTVETAIGKVIEDALAPVKVLGVDLVEGQDYDGNDVIFVTIRLPGGTGPLSPADYVKAIGEVSRTLLNANDGRLPLFGTAREGEPDTVEDEPVAAS